MKNRLMQSLTFGFISILLIISCSKKSDDPSNPVNSTPVLTTDLVSMVKTTSAVVTGTISSDGGAEVTLRGACWSRSADPMASGFHTVEGTGTGTFYTTINGLDTNTLYYVRAYATNSKGTAYGNTISFTTAKEVHYGSVKDVDGFNYSVIKIGDLYWLKQNLRVTHYRNGDAIPRVTADNSWKVLATGAYCIYNNLQGNDSIYGNLYNWHAQGDSRGLCPSGWRVPSDDDWNKLGNFLGGAMVAGGSMKSTGTIEQTTGLWFTPNTGATDSSRFSGLPGGYRINYGTYYSMGNVGYFWSSSDTATVNAWNYILDANNSALTRIFNLKTNGFSVRCCKN
ncbi:MAG: fibrobacter succinogenes major paralogous domain-containing protein [Bacteroidales bacterium]